MLLTMVATCNVKITDILEKTENKNGFVMSWGTLVKNINNIKHITRIILNI